MRVKCFAQEHNTMSPARARTRTVRSGEERTKHEATTPPARPLKEVKNSTPTGDTNLLLCSQNNTICQDPTEIGNGIQCINVWSRQITTTETNSCKQHEMKLIFKLDKYRLSGLNIDFHFLLLFRDYIAYTQALKLWFSYSAAHLTLLYFIRAHSLSASLILTY